MPGFREDKGYWEQYLRSYCKTKPNVEGAVVAASNGEFIAAILPSRVDKNLLANQVGAIALARDAIVRQCKLHPGRPITSFDMELDFITICYYPTKEIFLIALWRKADWRVTFEKCPDVSDSPTTAVGSKRIGPFPRFDEGEAEAEIND